MYSGGAFYDSYFGDRPVQVQQGEEQLTGTQPQHHHQQQEQQWAQSPPAIPATVAGAGSESIVEQPQPSTKATPQSSSTAPATSTDSTYVLRIHEMLEDSEKEGQQGVVSWQPHGRAFKIHHEEEFKQKIMPRYFRASYDSFRRWLRAWGFERMTEGPDRGGWYHRYFVRGVTGLSKNMTRQQMLQAMEDWLPAGEVPDFYKASTSVALSESKVTSQASSDPSLPLAKNPKKLRGTILEDLRDMLHDAELKGHQNIVSWMPHGHAFRVHKKPEFVQKILPRHFKTAKLTYFSDTLRIWGFARLKHGPDKGAYFHRYFVKGNPSLSRHRSRQQMKDAMANWPQQGGEPNFYAGQAPLERQVQRPSEALVGQDKSGVASDMPPAGTGGIHVDSAIADGNEMAFTDIAQSDEAQQLLYNVPPVDPTALQLEHANPHEHGPHGEVQQPIPADLFYDTTFQDGGAPNRDQIASLLAPPDENKGTDGTYVLRIHEMLEDAEKQNNKHIVSWQPHGRAFKIHKEDEFVDSIMPRYFKCKSASFFRWLRAWGFVRMTEGRDRGAWMHRYFVRGVTSLCKSMTRQQMLQTMEDWLPAGVIPDFYAPGSGVELSETKLQSTDRTNLNNDVQYVKNPKKLRGTVPEDLRAMLQDAHDEGNEAIVSWLPHGRSFKIHKKPEFVSNIMQRYFKCTKFTYFSDTLRIWGFARIKAGPDKGAYYHVKFIRGMPSLSRHLSRQQMREAMAGNPAKQPSKARQTYFAPTERDEMARASNATPIPPIPVAATAPPDAMTDSDQYPLPGPTPVAGTPSLPLPHADHHEVGQTHSPGAQVMAAERLSLLNAATVAAHGASVPHPSLPTQHTNAFGSLPTDASLPLNVYTPRHDGTAEAALNRMAVEDPTLRLVVEEHEIPTLHDTVVIPARDPSPSDRLGNHGSHPSA